MRLRTILISIPLFFCILVLFGCKEKKQIAFADTPDTGTISISVDGSFEPVINEQIEQYERLYPGAKINAKYVPEATCLKNLFYDSTTRMVIITRKLSAKEEKFLSDSLHYIPAIAKIATDALAIIVNKYSSDSLFTLKRLQDQLLGKINRNQRIVFDGLSATSAVRYVTDSLLHGQKFDTSVVKAASNSQEVINYIASNRNAIGIVGINWVGNPEEPTQVEMLKKITIGYVQCDACEGKPFVKPMQESINSQRYPLVRGLYYVVKENYSGLGTGFSSFLRYEKGQLIFRRAYLEPVMDFDVRNVRLNETLPSR